MTLILIIMAIGFTLGMLLMLLIIRKLGQSSRHSLMAVALFSALVPMKPKMYAINKNQEPTPKGDNDYNQIVTVLKEQMHFTPAKAREAAEYAIKKLPDEVLSERIREALKYLGNGHKKLENVR